MKKCNFFQMSLKFPVTLCLPKAFRQNEGSRRIPRSANIKSVQRFLGVPGWWYHHFVPNFSQLAETPNALKSNGAKFKWTPECRMSAFEALRTGLTSTPILGHPNFDLPFAVYTDASNICLGTEDVLAYGSRSLNKAE